MPDNGDTTSPPTTENSMTRINLGGGRWFDPKKSERFEEDRRWNGNNHISVATGSQWEHEELYLTRSGTWILHEWSQWQGSTPCYSIVSAETAKQWLINQNEGDAAERLFPGALASAEV
jgi:hypothetical protein